jgi:uncharacterized membrane protein (UPF0136 family)
MRFSFKLLCAFVLSLMAFLFALNGWPGMLVSVALLCVASALFIDSTVKQSIVSLVGGLSLGAFCFSAGLAYLMDNAPYVPAACNGRRRWLCQAVEDVLQSGGPRFVGLLWFGVAAGLFLFSLKAFSYVWKRRQILK